MMYSTCIHEFPFIFNFIVFQPFLLLLCYANIFNKNLLFVKQIIPIVIAKNTSMSLDSYNHRNVSQNVIDESINLNTEAQ